MKNTLGGIGNRRKLTGKFYFKATGDTGFVDLGNIMMQKRAPKIDRYQFKEAKKGFTQTIEESVSNIEDRFEIKGNEHSDQMMRLMLFAERGTDVTQAATNGVTGSIDDVLQERSYYIGARNVSNFVVDGYTVDVDYTVDLGSGMISILKDGGIADGTDLDLTFDMAAIDYALYTSPSAERLTRRGTAILVEFDQTNEAERSRHTFPCTIGITDFGDAQADKETEGTIGCLVTGPVVTHERIDS